MEDFDKSCSKCGRLLLKEARFCGSCGSPSPDLMRERLLERQKNLRKTKMATQSLAIAFTGTIMALFAHAALYPGRDPVTAGEMISSLLLEIAVGCAAAAPIGMSTAAKVLQRGAPGRDFAWALPIATLSFAISWLWIELLRRFSAGEGTSETINLWLMMQIVLIAPLAEEWICRGIMWKALRILTTEQTTIFATALLFAFLHFLNGGNFLELPHRFVAGLLFGILRAKSGSLWPAVFAHFLVNLMAVTLS